MSKKPGCLLVLVIAFMGVLGVSIYVHKVEAQLPTIYIRADGSVDPDTASISSLDNVTYTFTSNINESIGVERSNIIIDGNGYTLNGSAGDLYAGFTVNNIDPQADDNVTIQNVNVMGFLVGFWFTNTEGNKILGCNVTNNIDGIWFGGVWNSTISGNNIANNSEGIELQSDSSNNTVSENNITDNWGSGIFHHSGSDNKFYHNNFINNSNHVAITVGYANIWDDGAGEGNYWSDYEDKYPDVEDVYSGPYQNETGSDGIWDYPYVIDEYNQDNYPIVPEFPTRTSMLLILIVLTVVIVIYKRRLLKTPIH